MTALLHRHRFLLWGAAFGFVLSRARATDPDLIAGMFALRELHLLLVIGGAVALGALTYRGVVWLRARRRLATDLGAITRVSARTLAGATIFGVGWGLSGTCPGTAFVQLGEGKLLALFTVLGMLLGTWLQARVASLPSRARSGVGLGALSPAKGQSRLP
ncbi:MAG: YeeE/YedE thiosulfate transporter family protein [Deltaproteobacteria bacterium]|nr:YeeE/YedE thiosulfate transporter family protein [Deltaproteobacteria bacterium]